MSFDKDIVDDYACPINGSANVTPFFCDWRADAQAWLALHPGDPVNLTIPAHTYNFSGLSDTGRDSGGAFYLSDLLNTTVTITATGATFLGQFIQYGNNYGMTGNYDPSPASYISYIDTVSAGASSVQLSTPAEASRFSVNSYVYIGGLDLQGDGQPANHQFFEYVYITGISGGTITFSAPLVNSYRSDWPNYGTNVYNGGPAALYVIDSGWNQDLEIIGLTITATVAAPNSRARHLKFTNCTVTDNLPNPSEIQTYEISGGDWSGAESIEVDKLVDHIIVDGGAIARWDFQSSSIKKMTLLNGATFTESVGTPQVLEVYSGSTITTLSLGAHDQGSSYEFTANNSAFTTITASGVVDKGVGDVGINNDSNYSITGGVIRVIAARLGQPLPLRWAVPGAYCFWQGSNGTILGLFRVNGVTMSGGYIYVATSETRTGFPDATDWGGDLWIRAHPCPRMRVTNCTGAGAQYSLPNYYNRPLYSYYKTTFTEDTIGYFNGPGYTGTLWGELAQVNVNVIESYSGAENPCPYGIASYAENYPLNKSNFDLFSWGPKIDLRTTGLRVINNDGTVTGSVGADANIDFSTVDPVWLTQGFSGGTTGTINIADDGDASVSVEVEIFTDQGVSYHIPRSIEIHGGTYRGY